MLSSDLLTFENIEVLSHWCSYKHENCSKYYYNFKV